MAISDTLLAKISLAAAVSGLVLLFFLNAFAQPVETDIRLLDESWLEKRVAVNGSVEWYHLSQNVLIFTLSDEIGLSKIKCVIFSPSVLQRELVFKNAFLNVQGKVQRYKGELEIVAEKIVLLDEHD